jgi:hypothetical protein
MARRRVEISFARLADERHRRRFFYSRPIFIVKARGCARFLGSLRLYIADRE